jgi:DNA-directed RNA polymerase alpha subunit
MPVRDCGFETSIKNAFLIRGIETLSDLVRLSESDLLSLRSIGRKRIDRITEFLQQKNLHLKKDETHKQILNR